MTERHDDSDIAKKAGFVLLRDQDGLSHAIRRSAVRSIHESDPVGDMVILNLAGGRAISLPLSMDEALRLLA